MPIMAANAQNDARGSAWLLASAATRCLADPAIAPDWQDALNNTYRMLEAFKLGILPALGTRRECRPLDLDGELFAVGQRSDRHLSELKDALDRSISAVFEAAPKEAAVNEIENVLRAISSPQTFSTSRDELERARSFFNEFLKQLSQ